MSSERGPNYLETVYLFGTPGRDRRLAPGTRGRRGRVLLPAHDDARPGPAPAVGRRDHPQRDVPGDGRAGPPPADPLAMTRRVGLIGKPLKRRHSQVMHDAAFDAAGIDARYVLLELEPEAVEAAVREARGPGLARPRRDGAVQAGRGRPRATRSRPTRRRSARSTTSSRTDDGRLVGFNTDAPGFQAGRRAGDGPSARRRRGRRRRGRWRRPCGRLRLPPRRRAAGRRSATGPPAPAAALVERFAGVGRGARSAVALDDPRSQTALAVGGPGGQRDDRRHARPGRDDPGRAAAGDARPCSTSSTCRPRRRCSRRPGRAACGRRTGRRCSSPRRPSRSSAGPASAAWPTSCARPSRRCWPTPTVARLTDAPRDDPRDGRPAVGRRPRRDRCLPLPSGRRSRGSIRGDRRRRRRMACTASRRGSTRSPPTPGRPLDDVELGPAVPDPGAIYTVGLNYDGAGRAAPRPGAAADLRQGGQLGRRPRRDAGLGPRADRRRRRRGRAGRGHRRAAAVGAEAMDHVFGYTCINDVSSRDAWLDGDQWLLGKSMPGLLPGRPVDRHGRRARPGRLPPRLHDRRRSPSRTAGRRTCGPRIADIVAFLSRHPSSARAT